MRDILFRAKRKDNSEWIEGYYYKRIQERNVVDAIETYDGNIHSIEYYEIDPKTLCQYTGKTDKYGKKIWENDIVSAVWYSVPLDDATGLITFYEEWCGYIIHDKSTKSRYLLSDYGADVYEFEVIGNIFDNPELIKD